MFACICHAVTDEEVVAVARKGAATVETIGNETGAGTGCGSCQDHLEDLIGKYCHACPMAGQPA